MEFLNIGGGELLVIVLLAIILFGPEDILKIMQTVGRYVRKIQQMWTQVSAGLKGEFPDDIIPEEIQETIKETRDSVTEVQKTLAEIKASAEADLNVAKAAVEEVTTLVETDLNAAKATATEIKTSLEDIQSSVETNVGEIPKAVKALSATSTPQTARTSPQSTTSLTETATLYPQTQIPPTVALPDTASPLTEGEKVQTAISAPPGEDR
ncbi:MAG TPA: hypothetical protein PLH19_15190 [Anaerolineae bacterium]|nr:hypothetical protein [Anaerolineae bacterium]HQH39859.1 hypothetical protein [Anaerolineae bacterium]